jgi:hypothetical protein
MRGGVGGGRRKREGGCASRHMWLPSSISSPGCREVHVYGFGDGTGSHKGLVRGAGILRSTSSALGTNQDNYAFVTQLAQTSYQSGSGADVPLALRARV